MDVDVGAVIALLVVGLACSTLWAAVKRRHRLAVAWAGAGVGGLLAQAALGLAAGFAGTPAGLYVFALLVFFVAPIAFAHQLDAVTSG